MKKIIIDFEKSLDPYSGLGQFCLFLKKQFEKTESNIEYFIPRYRKLFRFLPFLLPKSQVFHSIHQDSPYVPVSNKTKYIITIHDFNAIYENTDLNFKKTYLKKIQKKIDRAQVVTFISEFTKTEAFSLLNLNNKKTFIIYNGISLPENHKEPKIIPKNKYLFTIGTVLPKKNFHVLVEMMKYLPEYELIIAGTTFHRYAIEMQAKVLQEDLDHKIHFVGTISNEEKLWYYKNASAFVFPSLLEGFGLPVAEAQSLGLPLFLSNLTSVPEIGGPDAYYFENFNGIEMAKTIQAGLLNFDESRKLRLIEHAKKFNWEIAAKKYLDIYNNL